MGSGRGRRPAREAIDRSGVPFVLVGRTDSLRLDDPDRLAECVRRGNAFRGAGADCVFTPGASDPDTIATLVQEIDAPLNVVVGLTGNRLSLAELAALGVIPSATRTHLAIGVWTNKAETS
jgi:2-methylisocitrate lyase-like PEP mutase family enzyme